MSPLTILFSLLLSACLSQNLTLPKRVTIPRGGCRQVPFLYTNMPFENSLTFSDPSNSLEITPNHLQLKQYTTTEQYQTFLFCLKNSTNSTKANNFTIQYSINGPGWDNNNNLQKGTLLISITNPTTNTTTTNTPQLKPVEWKNQQIKNTCAEFTIKTPGNGSQTLYYEVSNHQQNQLEDCREFQNFCRSVNRDNGSVWISKRQGKGGQMNITQFNLLEGRNYNVCAFYREKKSSKSSDISCTEFTTGSSGNMLRGRFKFTQQMDDPRKVNAFLCFITYYLEANPSQVTTIDGLSCDALSKQPQTYHQLYKAGVTTRSGNETILYIYQGCDSSEQRKAITIEVQLDLEQEWSDEPFFPFNPQKCEHLLDPNRNKPRLETLKTTHQPNQTTQPDLHRLLQNRRKPQRHHLHPLPNQQPNRQRLRNRLFHDALKQFQFRGFQANSPTDN